MDEISSLYCTHLYGTLKLWCSYSSNSSVIVARWTLFVAEAELAMEAADGIGQSHAIIVSINDDIYRFSHVGVHMNTWYVIPGMSYQIALTVRVVSGIDRGIDYYR